MTTFKLPVLVYSTRCVIIAVSEWTERWEVRSLWRSLGKAESPVRGWWEIRQWNHHTYLQGGSGKKKGIILFICKHIFTAFLWEMLWHVLYKQYVCNGYTQGTILLRICEFTILSQGKKQLNDM